MDYDYGLLDAINQSISKIFSSDWLIKYFETNLLQ